MQFKTLPTEFKFVEAGKVLGFAGYASKFNGIDAYGDMILPGAYEDTLKERQRPILMKRNHFEGVIGKWTNIKEDDVGLWVEGELTPGHSLAQDTYALLKHGAISGLSIGYFIDDEEPMTGNGAVRLLKKISLSEISIVDSPADAQANVMVVKDASSLKEIEAMLRMKGFSQSEATAIVARVKSLTHGERGDEAKKAEEAKKLAELIGNFKLL